MSTEQDRDQGLERLLRQSLKRASDQFDSPDCLDAETLAAWLDGGLLPAAREAAERHAAGCARCQMLLASVAQTEPGDAVDDRVHAVVPAAVARAWWRAPSLRWLVPAAGLATAVAVWVAVPRRQETAPLPQTVDAVARVELPVEPTDKLSAAQPAAPQPEAAAKMEAKVAAPPPTTRDEKAIASAPPAAANASGALAKADADANRDRREAPASPPPPVAEPRSLQETVTATADAPVVVDQQAAARASRQDAASATAARSAATPAAPAVSGARAVGAFGAGTGRGAAAGDRGGAGRGGAAAVVVTSPEPAIRWRIRVQTLEASSDSGATWQAIPFAGDPALLQTIVTGASPASNTCWFVGRSGTVLLLTDRTIRQVTIPDPSALVRVQAASASAAVVTTADGRGFATSDAGQTWRLVP